MFRLLRTGLSSVVSAWSIWLALVMLSLIGEGVFTVVTGSFTFPPRFVTFGCSFAGTKGNSVVVMETDETLPRSAFSELHVTWDMEVSTVGQLLHTKHCKDDATALPVKHNCTGIYLEFILEFIIDCRRRFFFSCFLPFWARTSRTNRAAVNLTIIFVLRESFECISEFLSDPEFCSNWTIGVDQKWTTSQTILAGLLYQKSSCCCCCCLIWRQKTKSLLYCKRGRGGQSLHRKCQTIWHSLEMSFALNDG